MKSKKNILIITLAVLIIARVIIFIFEKKADHTATSNLPNRTIEVQSLNPDANLSKIPEEDKETIRKTKKDDLIMFHHGWGTGIRNHYGLWRGNHALVKDACGEGCHPDDASMVIIEAVWKALQKECEFSHQVQHSGNEL